MQRIFASNVVNKEQIIRVCASALRLYDGRLIDHGERVAYIAMCIYDMLEDKQGIDRSRLAVLSLFHDVGAFKTEEIDRMVEFESDNVREHSVYGYLFLKYFSPLADCCKAILFHHTPYSEIEFSDFALKFYSALIFLSDRVDVAMVGNTPKGKILSKMKPGIFCPEHIDALALALERTPLYENLVSGEYKQVLLDSIPDVVKSQEEAVQYLYMLVFSVDFKSKDTVFHSVTTAKISVYIAKRFNLSEREIADIYFGAFVHDLGKIATPTEILEFPGRLNDEQMAIMKEHVNHTREIIAGLFPDEICQIAVHHHEKLNGSGYPEKLTAESLSLPDRIVAVADILSALMGKRSYKDNYDKERTLGILEDMAERGQLDRVVVDEVKSDYDALARLVQTEAEPIIRIYNNINEEYRELLV